MTSAADVVADIEALYVSRGGEMYGEAVTMFEHSLLTAATAEAAGAPDELVAACLLHDIGHLLVEPDDEYGKHSHDEVGADWLAARFPPAVSEPTRHHVAAKRYLCAIEPVYYEVLSAASQYTLTMQGGAMSADEITDFESQPYFAHAVQLRRWEDGFAKAAGVEVPKFGRYRALLERLATPATGGAD